MSRIPDVVSIVHDRASARAAVTHDDVAGEAFAEWVRPHLVAMSALAARLAPSADRDDIVQEALSRAWRKRDQFDPARGTPRVWLLAITADRARHVKPQLSVPFTADPRSRTS